MKAFQPHAGAQTLLATASGTSSRIALGTSAPAWRIYNAGTAALFATFGSSTVTAAAPTAGVAGSFVMAPGAVEVISPGIAGPTHVAVLGSGAVYLTPGEGL